MGRNWLTDFDLLKTLVRRDLEARYKGTVLGKLWPFMSQLSLLLLYIYVFAVLLKVKPGLKVLPGDSYISFGLWLFAGLLPWLTFTSSLS